MSLDKFKVASLKDKQEAKSKETNETPEEANKGRKKTKAK